MVNNTTNSLIIPRDIYLEMLNYCQEKYPLEACGILAGRANEVFAIYKMTNVEESSVKYRMDAKEQFQVMKDIREKSLSLVAIFHSHPVAPPYPSSTDLSLAFYEDSFYIIISFTDNKITTKAFKIIMQKDVEEIEIIIK
ncbi:MAG: M67 family metallopeptidase [Thermodesulfovibrionales bacterium]|nr:M67 family metallopeptidase [Thermodesulfovibrionales bacterium]